MKVYMSVDLEGITGVVSSQQIPKSPGALPEVRELLVGDVNAAIEGARQAGATTIWVNENHDGRELIAERVDPMAEVLLGNPKPLQTMDGIDASFDCVFMIGIHAQVGTASAVLDHTWKPKVVAGMRVNGVRMGELGLAALIAGHYGVPMALVTGDAAVAQEARELLGDVECAVVKVGLDRYSARCLHPARARQLICECAERALRETGRFKPLRLEPPLVMEMDYTSSACATRAAWIPGAVPLGVQTVSFAASDAIQLAKTFFVAATLPATIVDPLY
jgi:D-amino peptidase